MTQKSAPFYPKTSFLLMLLIGIMVGMILHYFPVKSLKFFQMNILFLGAMLLFILTPLSSCKIQSKHLPKYKFITYAGWIISFQTALYLTSIGFARIAGQLFPIMTAPQPDILSTSVHFLLWENGLFPWGLTLSWLICLCAFSFFIPLKPHKKIRAWLNAGKAATNLILSVNTLLCLSTASVCFVLLLAYFIVGLTPLLVVYGPQMITLIVVLITLILITQKFIKRGVMRLNQYLRIPAAVWLCFLIAMTFILILSSTVLIGSIHMPLTIPPWLQQWMQQVTWSVLCKIIIGAFWVTTVPASAIFIARMSNGYSLRTIMLTVLFFPTMMLIIFKCDMQWHLIPSFIPLLSASNLTALIGAAAFVYFLCPSRKWTEVTLSGRFPKDGNPVSENHRHGLIKVVRWPFFSTFYAAIIYGIPLLAMFMFGVHLFFLIILLIETPIFLYLYAAQWKKRQY
jgi:hypothetical protein